jgi:hypothetical protein
MRTIEDKRKYQREYRERNLESVQAYQRERYRNISAARKGQAEQIPERDSEQLINYFYFVNLMP